MRTPLYKASSEGHVAIVKILFEHGANAQETFDDVNSTKYIWVIISFVFNPCDL